MKSKKFIPKLMTASFEQMTRIDSSPILAVLNEFEEKTGILTQFVATHGTSVRPTYVNTDKEVLRIFNWSRPDDSIGRTDPGVLPIIEIGEEQYKLDPGQEDFITISEIDPDKYTTIADNNGVQLAIIDDLHLNLYITFDIAHCGYDNPAFVDILQYLLNKLQGVEPKKPSIEEAKTDNTDEIKAAFLKVFVNRSKSRTSEDRLKEIEEVIATNYNRYVSTFHAFSTEYRDIKAGKMESPEKIIEKANALTTSIKSFPLISSLGMHKGYLRVTTKQLMSTYWKGPKEIVICIPVAETNKDRGIIVKVYEIYNKEIYRIPVWSEHLYRDSSICLGTLNHTIGTNILGGDWDIAVIGIIRGLINEDTLFSESLRWYAQNKDRNTLSRAIVAEWKNIYDTEGWPDDEERDYNPCENCEPDRCEECDEEYDSTSDTCKDCDINPCDNCDPYDRNPPPERDCSEEAPERGERVINLERDERD